MPGQNKDGLTKTIPVSSIQTFLHYRPNGTIPSIENLLANPNSDSIALPLQEAGTHMIVLQQSRGPQLIPVDSLEKLFSSEGVPIKTENGENLFLSRKEVRVEIRESLKTLIQVSGVLTNACIQSSKLLLDIIPEINPNAVPRPGWKEGPVTVRFRVLFKGKPLAYTWVVVSYQIPGKGWQTSRLQTNKRGWIEADRHPGAYRLSCVYSKPTENDPAIDLEYYWGSLRFDYSQYFR